MPERPGARPPRSRGKARDREREALAELIEVERAIAALEGRNVDNAEYLIDARLKAEERKVALEQVLAAAREEMATRRKKLPFKVAGIVAGLAVLGAAGAWIAKATSAQLQWRADAADAANEAAKPFARGFTTVRTEVGSDPFTFAAGGGTCTIVVAAGTKGSAHIRVERGGVTNEADGSLAFCSCKAEDAQITAAGQGLVAAVVMKAQAESVGGADALVTMSPPPGRVVPEAVDRACAEAAFDGWLAGSSAAAPKADPDRLVSEERALGLAGLAHVAFSEGDAPFVVVPPAKESCALAVSRGGGLALRKKGGDRSIATKKGAVGACGKDLAGLSVWRTSPGDVVVFEGPRARVGGLLGLREIAERAGFRGAVWTASVYLADAARAALAASGISIAPGTDASDRPGAIALSTDARSTITGSSVGKEAACRPLVDVGVLQAMCLEGRAGAFDASGAQGGFARAAAPLWLATPPSPDRAALDRGLALLAFARRMTAEGFELTSLVGATLTPRGAKVTGRSGEKEVVAIVVSPAAPYVHGLSVGPAWTLEQPQRTLLAPGEVVELTATPRYAGSAKREFVVWRR
ncbi:MAG: hypothetical protein U0441_12880 [Polyangiaceae bacterium]